MKQKENNQTPEVINFDYEGNPVSFTMDGKVMVNATQMAKSFGKRPSKWLELPSTKEFLDVLSSVRKSDTENLVVKQNGGSNPGTWMHEDVALEFSRWLSPKFAIWCNDRIKEILAKGQMPLPTIKKQEMYADLEWKMLQMDKEITFLRDTDMHRSSWNEIDNIYKQLNEVCDYLYSSDYYEGYKDLEKSLEHWKEIAEERKRMIKLLEEKIERLEKKGGTA